MRHHTFFLSYCWLAAGLYTHPVVYALGLKGAFSPIPQGPMLVSWIVFFLAGCMMATKTILADYPPLAHRPG